MIVAGSLAIGFLLVFAVSRSWCPFSRIRPGIFYRKVVERPPLYDAKPWNENPTLTHEVEH